MSREPIEIVVRKTNETSGQQRVVSSAGDKVKGSGIMQNAVSIALVDAGKEMAMNGFNQFMSLSGNTNTLKMIENVSNVASMATQAIVGKTLGVIAVGVQLSMKAVSMGVSNYQANLNADLLYERSGNATLNGGRGTYD